jgi:hypothetical protein
VGESDAAVGRAPAYRGYTHADGVSAFPCSVERARSLFLVSSSRRRASELRT